MSTVDEITVEKLVKSFEGLYKRSKHDFQLHRVLSDYGIPNFKGSDAEFEFLIGVLRDGVKKEEEWNQLRGELEKEKQLHLETIHILELASPNVPKHVLDERLRIRSETQDTLLKSLRAENNRLQSELSTIEDYKTREKTAQDALQKTEKNYAHARTRIDKMIQDHADVLMIYQAEIDEALNEIKWLKTSGNPENQAENPDSQARLQQLWDENLALGEQLDHFKKLFEAEKVEKDGIERKFSAENARNLAEKDEEIAILKNVVKEMEEKLKKEHDDEWKLVDAEN